MPTTILGRTAHSVFLAVAVMLLLIAVGSSGDTSVTYRQSDDVLGALARVSTSERTRRALNTHQELRVVLGNDAAACRGADKLMQATRGVETWGNAADMYERVLTTAKQRIGERLASLRSGGVQATHKHEMQRMSEPSLRTVGTVDEAEVRAILERVVSEHGAG